jgi:hypothetical protein
MFEQLTQLAHQFGQNAVVENDAIPNDSRWQCRSVSCFIPR